MKKMHTEVENFYVSFSDLLSLLLIFFVYLFSMATIDPVKYNQTSESLSEEFAKESGGGPKTSKDERSTQAILVGKLQSYIQKEHLEEQAQVQVTDQYVKVVLSSPVLFQSGSADLSQEGRNILMRFGPAFKEVSNPVIVEGHTDNVPISTSQFESNWELSFHRALSVMKFLMNNFGFTPKQLSGIGYGEYRPAVPNNSELNRAKNRRIEVNIVRNYSTPAEDLDVVVAGEKKKAPPTN
ncbi:chemotaxis protein MotB [bacterium]|nr:chemotaxis protein MotB [bacterium]